MYKKPLVSVAVLATGILFAVNDARGEGAFAFGQGYNGAWASGPAWNMPTVSEANQHAFNMCQQWGAANGAGRDCKVITGFSGTCFAFAVQNNSNGYNWAVNPDQKKAREAAVKGCQKMGKKCQVVSSHCDTVVEARVLCTHPVFAEEYKLRASIDGNPQRTETVTQAINYMRAKYCKEVKAAPRADRGEHVGDNCTQMSGMHLGERVYWGECGD